MTDRAIDEIRKRRRQVLAENYQGSIDKMTDSIIVWQKEHPRQIVNLHGKKTVRKVA